MATITDVKVYSGQTLIANAASGEIVPPPHMLTITGMKWRNPPVSDPMDYLQKTLTVKATRVGLPYQGNFKVFSIGQDRTTVRFDSA